MPNNYFDLSNSIFSVTEISSSIKKLVEESYSFVKIKGEISKPSFPSSGHIYFNLKDENAILSAVIWRYNLSKIKINLEEGLEIICSGKITTFSGQSKYQIIIDSIEISGEGALLKLFEERKKKYLKLGYFDNKKKQKLPFLPRSIAVVTSSSGAVINDIINRISNRFPLKIYLFSVSVQGINSAKEVSNAINKINQLKFEKILSDIDVIIVARGGGSVEDLWGFNEENVIIATYKSKIPIISAIGHETDTTLLDYVSDLRAPTPSAAAEISVPVLTDLKRKINDLSSRKFVAFQNHIENLRNLLSSKRLSKPKDVLNHKQQKFDFSIKNLHYLISTKINDCKINFNFQSNLLQAPIILMKDHHNNLNLLSLKYINLSKTIIEKKVFILNSQVKLLEANSYEKNLDKGFGIILDNKNNIIKKKKDIKNKEGKIQFIDGTAKIKFLNN
ncbi:MAG: exodeoxyribonuclease VII large subunit [SAR116 cluster bacterium]|nr:exodeoxyribonuclease VII large subunit [SAR116 cluster bacterium]RPH09567.1 MAG: exodeoxyribonuclease VII large subunit [Alphaproteobacteria bacterium TMED54]